MWKRVGLFLAVSWLGLGAGTAEARFGKSSSSSSSGSSGSSGPSRGSSGHSASPVGSAPSHSPGRGADRPYRSPSYGYGYNYGVGAPYPYYPGSWGAYYYDPSWAWPFLGAPTPYYGSYYDLRWRRHPRPYVQEQYEPSPVQMDLSADAGFVSQGYAVGLGVRMEGKQLGFGARLDMFDLATDDGSAGRDSISLLSLQPSVAVVARDNFRWRFSGGMNVAFAPDVIMVAPGVGTSALLRIAGPLKIEASAQYAPWPFTQLGGDAGLAVDIGNVVRLRGGYRATYLNDQGRVNADGRANSDLFAGPYAGLSLLL